ncbi:hypothetical protein C8039_16295 [Halogeometricum sp. wsp3]|nr:hypothetical protein C8039_16295 [Halogeometricum sp. wsp3]
MATASSVRRTGPCSAQFARTSGGQSSSGWTLAVQADRVYHLGGLRWHRREPFTIEGNYVPLIGYWTNRSYRHHDCLGGVGSLFGPLFGAGLYLYIENIVSGFETLGPSGTSSSALCSSSLSSSSPTGSGAVSTRS